MLDGVGGELAHDDQRAIEEVRAWRDAQSQRGLHKGARLAHLAFFTGKSAPGDDNGARAPHGPGSPGPGTPRAAVDDWGVRHHSSALDPVGVAGRGSPVNLREPRNIMPTPTISCNCFAEFSSGCAHPIRKDEVK
ncbi:hypothetical protein GCM10009799_50350 [Nocardiopsis rhodophaea]|uniref:SWIM-type domain-containing protein n=1 Tax=Nocardiopsis rhodophaea TaxID=280238 RepID=A0ABP5F416_9ACTN